MTALAEKLAVVEDREIELPPLPKGDTELGCLAFPQSVRFLSGLGTQLMLGRTFNDFDISGQTVRIAVKPSGVAYALIRVGGRPSADGMKILGGRLREILFFSNGMYGPVKE